MPTLPNMGLITPTLGADKGVWDDKINAMAGQIDAHDHTAGKGLKITPAAMTINADLPFGGNAATGLGKVAFTAVTALAAGLTTLFVNTADGELYWRTAGGANVKLTAGSSINTTLVGGIVGDYTSVGAEVAFDDANDRYTFKQQGSPHTWAVMASGEVRIYETGTSESVYVGQKAPAALAASYAVTWPLALPAAAQPLVSAADGTLSFGQAFALNVDQSITISGTATYKHGTKTINRPIKSAETYGGVISNVPPGGLLSASQTVYIPLPDLPKHARLKTVRLYYGSAADAAACLAKLFSTSDAVPCVGGFTDLSTVLTPGGTSIASTTGLTFQYTNAGSYWIQVTNTTGGERVSAVGIDYDVP